MDFDYSGFQIAHFKPCDILRERRVILGLTQKQVADRAKVVLQQYQKFESGERRIMSSSFELACRIIEALEMDITKFYHGDYTFGEEVFDSPEGLRYKKTGKLTSEDVE
ncbi:MAG: helix-turn-helix transcriptional regulator [Eubacteriales bacterium]|nr:helix-turn-helix transcriptional regulator [Eubacteriales bacterium]